MTDDERLLNRYQTCAAALWGMFGRDPLPNSDPAHFWIERLESLIARRRIAPVACAEEALRARIAELEGLADDLQAQRDSYRATNRTLFDQCSQLRRERNAAADEGRNGSWVWSDTDPNDLESLCEDALVSLTAGQLRALLSGQDAATPDAQDPRLDGMGSSMPGLELAPALAIGERQAVRNRHPTPWAAGIGGDDGKTGFINDADGRPVDFDDPMVCRHVARLVNGNARRGGGREGPPAENREHTEAPHRASRGDTK